MAVVLVILTPLLASAAEKPSPADLLSPQGVLQLRKLDNLEVSPDGRRVAFEVQEPPQGKVVRQNIWVLDLASRELRRFTTSPHFDSQPRWSPDGRRLAFLSTRSGKRQIHVMPVDGGEAEMLTEQETGAGPYAWSPDGRKIAFVAAEPMTEEEKKRKAEGDDAHVVTRNYYQWGKNDQFWVVDVATRETRQLTRGDWRFSNGDTTSTYFTWHPAGDRLLVSATDDARIDVFTSRLSWLPLDGGKLQELAAPRGAFGLMTISPDGRTIAFLGARDDGPEPSDLYVVPIEGGLPRNLTAASIDRRIKCYEWHKDGSLIVLAETGFAGTLYRCSLDGTVQKLKTELPPSTHWGNRKTFAVHNQGLVLVGESSTRAPELWLCADDGRVNCVTNLNEAWQKASLIRLETFTCPSFDGLPIEVGLLKPRSFEPGTPVPLVVLVHGGPTAHWVDRIEPWGQMLAAKGFAVAYPNIRGSTGYGFEFMAKVRRDPGGGDFKDVMAVVDHLVAKGLADAERLGVAGWSYGGYMSAWAVTQTNRFKASVSGAPITNLITEYLTEESWVSYYDTWTFGTPYQDWQLLTDRSPVAQAHAGMRTPTLILCGEKDIIDPLGECFQFHRALRHYQVETDLVIYPRSGHGISEEKLRVDMNRRVVDWFEKHLAAAKKTEEKDQ
ncbi:MAG: prolyl oligopeptidase family serine peptidase [Acidobacteriota bacterium]